MMTVPVTAHIDERMNEEMEELKKLDRRLTKSRIIEESVKKCLPEFWRQVQPGQEHPVSHN